MTARNIPAHAGKTHASEACHTICPEHPRARGENHSSQLMACHVTGTSPRTRGKPFVTVDGVPRNRNIPAHAGKTGCTILARMLCGEHPRARGENPHSLSMRGTTCGTSPRTRGKRSAAGIGGAGNRNIPAHAGKTEMRFYRREDDREHPRARGENSY